MFNNNKKKEKYSAIAFELREGRRNFLNKIFVILGCYLSKIVEKLKISNFDLEFGIY